MMYRADVPRGVRPTRLALQKNAVTAPIVGASKAQHLDDAVAALSLHLSTDEIAKLEAPYVPHRVVGFQ